MLHFLQLTQQPVFHSGWCSFAVAWPLLVLLTLQLACYTSAVAPVFLSEQLSWPCRWLAVLPIWPRFVLLFPRHISIVDTLASVLLSELLSWLCLWFVVLPIWPLFVPLFLRHGCVSALSALGLMKRCHPGCSMTPYYFLENLTAFRHSYHMKW